MSFPEMDRQKRGALQEGMVIPAHPLIVNQSRKLDEQRQRDLTRYYMKAGAGGIAIGVHTTQFALHRNPDMYRTLLQWTAEEIDQRRPEMIKIAGVYGEDGNALREAEMAKEMGYDLALVIPQGDRGCNERDHLLRLKEIARIIPLFGFYLQPSVGGCDFGYEYWREVAEIPNLYGIKVAAFNRYHTIDVVKAVAFSDRREEIALYTGNDDHIILDLLTPFTFRKEGMEVTLSFVGGLLGQWAVWTHRAVQLLQETKRAKEKGSVYFDLLQIGVALTDANRAIFDVKNQFKGSIAGIHRVLQKDGFIEDIYLLNREEGLSAGQEEEIERIYQMYPELRDDDFLRSMRHGD